MSEARSPQPSSILPPCPVRFSSRCSASEGQELGLTVRGQSLAQDLLDTSPLCSCNLAQGLMKLIRIVLDMRIEITEKLLFVGSASGSLVR